MRKKGVEWATVRSLISDLVLRGEVKTTGRRAKKVQPQMERMVSLVKTRGLGGVKEAVALMGNRKEVVRRLREVVIPQLGERRSGFTRIVRLGRRRGDGAMMVKMAWVEDKFKMQNAKFKIANQKSKMGSKKEDKEVTEKVR